MKYSWLYFWVTVLKLTSCDKKETLLKERGRGWRGAGGGGGGGGGGGAGVGVKARDMTILHINAFYL